MAGFVRGNGETHHDPSEDDGRAESLVDARRREGLVRNARDARQHLRRSERSASGTFDLAIQPGNRPGIDKDQRNSALHEAFLLNVGNHGPECDRPIAIGWIAD